MSDPALFVQIAETGNTAVGIPEPAASAADRALALLDLGGPIVIVLLVLSVLALAIMFLKIHQFWRLGLSRRDFVAAALEQWRAGRVRPALDLLARVRNPIARPMEVAILGLADHPADESKVREEVLRVASGEIKALGAHLRGLDVIATLAPLLGLLGTVLGMISAFQDLQQSGSRADPGILAGGIWEALLTTAVGLSVAVPTSAVLSLFESAVDRLRHAMEDAVTRVFTVTVASPDHRADNARPADSEAGRADPAGRVPAPLSAE